MLSVPSVVFAEANWYGSLRGGVTFGGGADTRFMDGGSRWGIKGSNDLGEGLSALYRFEHKFSTENAGQAGGRLAYVGLSGGFGTLSLGQVWSASYNATGAITDNSNYFGNSETTYRHGNALSWAYSAGAVGFQVDLVSDASVNSGEGLDKFEFGMTIGLGEIGKVAIAHTSVKDSHIMTVVPASYTAGSYTAGSFTAGQYAQGTFTTNIPYAPGEDGSIQILTTADNPATTANETEYTTVRQLMVRIQMGADADTPNVLTVGENEDAMHYLLAGDANVNLNAIELDSTDTANPFWRSGTCTADATDNTACVDAIVYFADAENRAFTNVGAGSTNTEERTYVRTFYAAPLNEEGDAINTDNLMINESVDPTVGTSASYTDGTYTPGMFTPGEYTPASMTPDIARGHKATHVAVELAVGGMTTYLGHSQKKENGAAGKSRTTHYGVRGPLGDTGLSFNVMGRSKKAADGSKSSPWLAGGAAIHFEHGNSDDGNSGKSRIGLHVTF